MQGQALHSLQLPSQSTGHGSVLHVLDWLVGPPGLSVGQRVPPFTGATCTAHARVSTPPPQLTGHELQSSQLPTQSTGHRSVLHDRVFVSGRPGESAGHAVPPLLGCVAMMNDCDCVPPPHLTEHTPQATAREADLGSNCYAMRSHDCNGWQSPERAPHAPTQFTAHGCMLQDRRLAGEHLEPPPDADCVTI